MNINDILYKRLINKALNLNKTNATGPKSPLIANLEKWAGKKLKIPSDPGKLICVVDNPWAQILGSPLRYERLTRTQLPSDLLIKSNYNGESVSLSHTALYQKTKSKVNTKANCYIINSHDTIHKEIKSSMVMLPLHVVSNKKLPKKVMDWDKEKLLFGLKNSLISEIIDLFEAKTSQSSNDLKEYVLVDNPELKRNFTLSSKNTKIQINIGHFDDKQIVPLREKIQKNSKRSLGFNNPLLFIKLYQLVCFLR